MVALSLFEWIGHCHLLTTLSPLNPYIISIASFGTIMQSGVSQSLALPS